VRLLAAEDEKDARPLLETHLIAVLCLGPGVPGRRSIALIEEAETGAEPSGRLNIVLAAGDDLSPFQDLIDRDRIFYLTQEPVPAADLAAILRGAADRWRAALVRGGEERERLALARRLLGAARDIAAEKKASGAGRAAADAAVELVGAERAWCLFYDPVHETLWAGDEGSPDARRESAAVGLVSFVTRTGRPVSLERLGGDPRFDRDADDPEAAGDERFAAVPVVLPAELAGAGATRVLAVIAAVRAAEAPVFSERDLETLARLAEHAAPTFAHLLPAAEEEEAAAILSPGLFREQAIEHHRDGLSGEGDLLRADPGWMRWTYRLLVAVVAVGLLFVILGKIREYASGPAVIRLGGRTDLTANAAGTVTQVLARPGERVARGRLLVRFYGAT
jgi:hypothetical protein